ncbi:hypothetical protein [Cupriavidus plantarum]|uniref:hypothetical protein n=1 Tax=Cupriavidus plantarum TaxID=942865 RepID=UPI00339DA834
MYIDKLYSDGDLCRVLEKGLTPDATADWPWQMMSRPGFGLARRRGLRSAWGTILLYTYDVADRREIGIEGRLADNPYLALGEMWGRDPAIGTYLSDLVAMHFARLADSMLTRGGWQQESRKLHEAGCIFRISAELKLPSPDQGRRLGKSLAAALVRADIENLGECCQSRAYLLGLKTFLEVPLRPRLEKDRPD